ncbi:uncharacterized protein [Antedon mediterranea]|uniref:uncharacterized protein n=1 Tax=Antedon mediterranea TaxID=105859 RepID=UPI003AF72AA5
MKYKMTLRHLTFTLLILIISSVCALDLNGEHVCTSLEAFTQMELTTESYTTSYSTSCGLFWANRCTRYRRSYRSVYVTKTGYRTIYVCCSGWAAPAGSVECTEPICAPQCNEGTCTGPNVCQCYPQYHGPRCEYGCNTDIDNCEIVDCTSHTNSVCTKCLFHISDTIKAFDLVGVQCNRICSWQLPCYPGTCTGDQCICHADFNGHPNCRAIKVLPIQSHCSVMLQDSGTRAVTTDMQCGAHFVYVPVQGNGLSVNWVTRYSGPTAAENPIPYYVNGFKVGIVSASVDWQISRGGTVTASGSIDCNLNHDQDDPNQGTHSCGRYGSLGQDLQHGDRLFITLSSTNGGFLRLKDYDFSSSGTVVRPVYYSGQTLQNTLRIIVDLEPPTHCSLSPAEAVTCSGHPLNIGKPYTKQIELEIKWSPWVDDTSGLNKYESRVCKMLIANDVFDYPDSETCESLDSTKNEDIYEAEFQPKSPGVYCAILVVDDIAGNIRYARRCFIFDDQSEVSIVEENPIQVSVDGESLNLETDAWITGDKNVQVSWESHFANQMHIDQKLLYAIKADNDIVHTDYDTEAFPAGRPITTIENRNGIVKFEVGVYKDQNGGVTFPSFEPTWMNLTNELDQVFIDSLQNAVDADTIGFLVRATDVMGNTKSDYIKVHIDSTSPIFADEFQTDGDGVYHVTAYDKESGIKNVHWQIISDDVAGVVLSEGDTDNFRFEGDSCAPTNCYCILSNTYCYKLQLDVTPTIENSVQEKYTSALLRVTITNNALLEYSEEIQISTSSILLERTSNTNTEESDDGGVGIGLIVGIAIGAALLLFIIFIVLMLIKRTNSHENSDGEPTDIGHQNPTFMNDPTYNAYAVSTTAASPPAYTPYSTTAAQPITKKHMVDDEYASPLSLGVTNQVNNTANEISPHEINNRGTIVDGNHSRVYKATVRSLGPAKLAVKSLKAGGTVGEKETILHEIKMMRKLPQHDNIIRLYGFTSTGASPALVLEFAPSGDLSKYLQQNAPTESLYDNQSGSNGQNTQLCMFAQQVCLGMQHIQRHKIIHRNLGARNILVGNDFVCKITDFGRAVVADVDGTYIETEEIQLPVRWTAVEGLRERVFSMMSDVWSFGVLLWEIQSRGAKPYGNVPIKQIAENVVDGVRLSKPQNCPDSVYLLMEKCWCNGPHQRPSFSNIQRDLDTLIQGDRQQASDGDEYMGLANLHR